MYLPEAPMHVASVALWSYEGMNFKEHYICTMDHSGLGESDHKLPQKDQDENYYTGSQKNY